jgi:hypothetical protein
MASSGAAKPRRAVLRKAADAGVHPAEPRVAAKRARGRAVVTAAPAVAASKATASGAAARSRTD